MGNRRSCARNLLYCFTVFFWVSGAVLLALGIYMVTELGKVPLIHILHVESRFPLHTIARVSQSVAPVTSEEMWGRLFATDLCFGALFAIGLGVLTLLVGVLACCAAALTSRVLNAFLIFFLVVFIVTEALSAVWVGLITYQTYFDKDHHTKATIDTRMKVNLQNAFNAYYDTKRDDIRPRVEYGFDNLQMFFQCCGINGTGDFRNRQKENEDFPLTCCKKAQEKGGALQIRPFSHTTYPNGCPTKAQEATIANPNAITTGCYEPLKNWLALHGLVFVAAMAGIVLVELFELGAAIFYCVRLCQSPYLEARADARSEARVGDASGMKTGEGELLVPPPADPVKPVYAASSGPIPEDPQLPPGDSEIAA